MSFSRLSFAAILLSGLGFFALPAESTDQPNFVIFFTDDQGYNDASCFGSPLIETPHLDRMAEEGLKLTSFYTQPVCGVSRAALLTGSYPIRVGEPNNVKNLHTILHPEEITLPEVLRTAGYATGIVGKWHLAGGGRGASWKRELLPNAQGFDYWFGTPSHNGTTRVVPEGRGHAELMRNGEIVDDMVDQEEMAYLTRQYTEEAIEFIRREKEKPFFLYLAHTMPHVPINATKDFLGKSKRGLYGDVVEELDWSLGQVLAELKEQGLDEKTIVIFTSDNGPWIEAYYEGEGGKDSHCGSADPLRGAKMTTWEGGIRVPTVVRWPGTIEAGRVSDDVVCSLDLFPTFANLGGARLPDHRTLDGVDQSGFLRGESDRSARDHFFYYAGTHLHAVRWKHWKLVRQREAKPSHLGWWARMVDAVPETALYDLSKDIGETTNIASDHADVVEKMSGLIEEGRQEIGDWDQVGSGARYYDEGPKLSAKEANGWQRKKAPAKSKGVKVSALEPFEPLGSLQFRFESADDPMEGWKIVEGWLAQPVSKAASLPKFKDRPLQRQGEAYLSALATVNDTGATDNQLAVIESPAVIVNGDKVAFLLSGGGPDTGVVFVDAESGKNFLSTGGPRGPQMKRYVLDFPEKFRGKPVKIRVTDQAGSGRGHVCFDDFSAEGELVE